MAARHHTATISPDLIQQLFQLNYEDDERERVSPTAELEDGVQMMGEEEAPPWVATAGFTAV